VNFDLDKEDRWVWKDGEELGYTAKSAYLRLREDGVGENGMVFKKFWKSKVVPTALDTTWRVLENKLATKANLERRGSQLQASRVVFVGSRRRLAAICSLSVDLLGYCAIIVVHGWACKVCFTTSHC